MNSTKRAVPQGSPRRSPRAMEADDDEEEYESVKVVSDDKGLESKLDEEFDSLEYENTAEAAKKLVDTVKILWSTVEPHLLKMLACLSVAALVTVMIKYSQRSRKVKVPVSQRMPSVPPRRVPVLAPHNTVPLPVFHSEQPVQRIVPKQESYACLELPVQSLLSESDQSVCLNVPSIGHRDRDQKGQQEDVCASMFHQLVIGIVIRKFSKRMVALKGLQMAVLWIIKILTDQSHRWFSCSETSHLSMQIAQDGGLSKTQFSMVETSRFRNPCLRGSVWSRRKRILTKCKPLVFKQSKKEGDCKSRRREGGCYTDSTEAFKSSP
ncbi:hypothetical protein VPH35_133997 [Triticum aestivum]|uniref:uncharacterized protein n=1 Tax=Triticum aestivum TaxID=4565 RepID=UPI001D03242E|nr:uncharacterized protein LOC123166446 [Triticum aestivum]